MRKWQVIYHLLDKLIETKWFEKYEDDLIKARDIAKKIDNILVKLYGDEQPNEHQLKIIDTLLKSRLNLGAYHSVLIALSGVARNPELCIACMASDTCADCKFAKKALRCDLRNSLYEKFYSTIVQIILNEMNIDFPDLAELQGWFNKLVEYYAAVE